MGCLTKRCHTKSVSKRGLNVTQIEEPFFLTVGMNLSQLSSLTACASAYRVLSELIERISDEGRRKTSNYYSDSHSAIMTGIANRYPHEKEKSRPSKVPEKGSLLLSFSCGAPS